MKSEFSQRAWCKEVGKCRITLLENRIMEVSIRTLGGKLVAASACAISRLVCIRWREIYVYEFYRDITINRVGPKARVLYFITCTSVLN